ncbi:MAG: transcriptional repressor [Bauldia sp.]|nr:transcriptional repressor [Bauldia sp.]MCW5716547.1 transcriptional repressor [Bauldia sp.]
MTRPRTLPARGPVYGALRSAGAPMTAYQILDAVRDQGITAPPTVYRALNRLVDEGLAHRVESLNAYVACVHSRHGDAAAIFSICENCGLVAELEATDAVAGLRDAASGRGFRVDRMTAEVRGLCGVCLDDPKALAASAARHSTDSGDHDGHDH